jgi:CHAD domain-containing protein
MARRAARIATAGQLHESVRTALLAEIGAALEESRRLASWEQPVRREAVHELRRALKRFRACAALCRGAVDAAEIRAVQEEVRTTAERLSATRDRDVMVETIACVVRVFPREDRRSVQAITTALVAPEKATTASADWQAASESIEASLVRLRDRIHGADLRAVAPDGIAEAIARLWRRARRDARVPWDAAHLERLHDLRKACQRLSAQLQLVAGLGPRRRLTRLARDLAGVVSAIGEDRDLGLLEERLRELAAHHERPIG